MGSSTLGIARAALLSGALLLVGATAASAADQRASRLPVADGPPTKAAARAAAAAAASAPSHHGPTAGHLPPRTQEMELVGRLEPKAAFGDIVPGQIADLTVHKGFAYLNSWDSADCTRGGTHVVDIRNPAAPTEVGFIPAPADYYHGEGAHAISINTPAFQGDILAVNDETYGSNILGACSDPLDQTFGGFDLYDVSNPANPQPLVQGAGDNDRGAGALPAANSYHSVFAWQDGPRAFLVATDNVEFTDIDIFDITDPRNPELIADIDAVEDFPSILDGEEANGGVVLHHDVVVKRIGARMVMLSDYWDAGYLQLDVTDPANPTLITDTTFAGEDPLLPGSGLTPEGNAHQGEFSFDNQFLLTADEDFAPFRLTSTITEAPFEGYQFTPAVSDAEPIAEGSELGGDTEYVGDACDTLPAPTAGVTIALAERGGVAPGGAACGFQLKIDNIEDAGYDMAIIFNNTAGAPPRCEGLINMLVDPATIAIPALFVGRADALRILGTFDESTYQCTGAATPTTGDTEAPPAGTQGLEIEVASDHDGWGYAHLYDAATSEELDAFAIPESLDSRFAAGFGDLSIHEFATDPATNLAYASYYSGGVRVLRYSRANGLEQVGRLDQPRRRGTGPGLQLLGHRAVHGGQRRAPDRGLGSRLRPGDPALHRSGSNRAGRRSGRTRPHGTVGRAQQQDPAAAGPLPQRAADADRQRQRARPPGGGPAREPAADRRRQGHAPGARLEAGQACRPDEAHAAPLAGQAAAAGPGAEHAGPDPGHAERVMEAHGRDHPPREAPADDPRIGKATGMERI